MRRCREPLGRRRATKFDPTRSTSVVALQRWWTWWGQIWSHGVGRVARGTASYSTSTARSSRARLSKHDEHGRPTRSRVGTQRHLVTSTDVHHLVAATSPAGIDTRRARSFDGARPEGLSPRSEVGLRLALLAALKLALDEFAAFVFRPCTASYDIVCPTRWIVPHRFARLCRVHPQCIRHAGRHSGGGYGRRRGLAANFL